MSKKSYSEFPVYDRRPYHALYISDEGEDDDVCVWKDGPPDLPDLESDDEFLANNLSKAKIDSRHKRAGSRDNDHKEQKSAKKTKANTDKPKARREVKFADSGQRVKPRDEATSQSDHLQAIKYKEITEADQRAFEIQQALSRTRKNLTRLSQYMLKLEARAGKCTKEGIRQTLDTTVQDMHYDFDRCGTDGGPPDADHFSEIEVINHLAQGLSDRMYLVDRNWRKKAKETRDAEGRCEPIMIHSEPFCKDWLKIELNTNHLVAEETCYYTAQDLVANRSFRDWVGYLRKLGQFKDHPTDDLRLVDLAWRFLDRNLRGPRPANPTPVEKFILELEEKKKSGVWIEALRNPQKQVNDDAEAWKFLKRCWSSRPPL
ncbi:hypothetical protein F5Y18DRAFT_442020 [Xylariaceae sp. FL1019]|nr:hypothetical protein F5Y18DRAFT_442020 [Xylariaceae sp. FL1019]